MSRAASIFFLMLSSLAFAHSGAGISSLSVSGSGSQQSVVNLDNKTVDPIKESSGKVAVLLFVRTNCPISNRYAPEIKRIEKSYSGKVKFWLVYPGKSETAGRIRTHDKEYGYDMPALRDPSHSLAKFAQATMTPEAAVFDHSGKLIYHGRIDNWYADLGRARPVATSHELEDAIKAGLEGKAPAVNTAPAVGCYITELD